jgi:hypothetical protein
MMRSDTMQPVSALLHLVTTPLAFSKIFCPATIFLLGICAWFCFRQWKLSPLACTLGALAAAFSSHFLSTAAWGVAAQLIGIGMCFVAIGLAADSSGWKFWVRIVLAGMAVGINIMEAYDIGAIFSLFVAAFVFFQSVTRETSIGKGIVKGALRVGVVAVFAAFCAAQALTVLIGTQIKGVSDEQGTMTAEQRWDWATQWSMPPEELPRIFISGLYGYRMDTPKDMASMQDWFQGGVYWGKVGQAPGLDSVLEKYHASGKEGLPPGIPGGAWRFSGGGEYAGVLVVVVALWAVAQSLRKKDSVFSLAHRKFIWFWSIAAFVSLLLATGRYAPFYRLFYLLPHASNIRNASKFMHPFHWSLVILFAYGVHGISQRYLAPGKALAASLFDRRWIIGSFVFIGVSIIGWLGYASEHTKLEKHLMDIGIGDLDHPTLAIQVARFSLGEVGWFVLFLILTVSLLTLVFKGRFTGERARLGAILLGVLLVVDLFRSDLPWIIYQNYQEKYASNAVIDFLREKPYEHRVTVFPNSPLTDLYTAEWAQHHFQYYNVQSLNDVQRPRPAADFKGFEGTLGSWPVRHWQLTNTRYLLGPAAWVNDLNQQLDPAKRRFQIAIRFDLQPKPGVTEVRSYEQLTAVPGTNGQYAVYDFTGALPRAKLYANWQISTNDAATLSVLTNTAFDPFETVLLAGSPGLNPSGATNQNPGSVEIVDYAPKKVTLEAKAAAPCVLLLNDKYDPNWNVIVDGKPQTLLRCNYIMRGVQLSQGDHKVEFRFAPTLTGLYASLAALVLGLCLVGVLIVSDTRKEAEPPQTPPKPHGPIAARKHK